MTNFIKEEKSQLHSFCGQRQWATSQTHPDLGFETCVMSNVGKHATVKDVDEANKALRKLQSKTVHLKFPNLGKPPKYKLLLTLVLCMLAYHMAPHKQWRNCQFEILYKICKVQLVNKFKDSSNSDISIAIQLSNSFWE